MTLCISVVTDVIYLTTLVLRKTHMKQDQILELNFIKKKEHKYLLPNCKINKKAREDCMSMLAVKCSETREWR
jgi:hypothetical protein